MIATLEPGLANCPVELPRQRLREMVQLQRTLYRLSQHPAYHAMVAADLPPSARFDPGNDSILMGYDFHLAPEGVRLIEVNTNAGGSILADRAARMADAPRTAPRRSPLAWLPGLLQEEISRCPGLASRPLQFVVILDENPTAQFLHPEMLLMRDALRQHGMSAEIVDPAELEMDPKGVRWHDRSVDLVYNRHCDFYLESPILAGLRAAYLAGTVCLSPNPRTYGLLADKRRMILWSDPGRMEQSGLSEEEIRFISDRIPFSRLLATMDPVRLWTERHQWVFKPVALYGSKGVLLGEKMTRGRFAELDPHLTLVQRRIPPSVTTCPGVAGNMKVDFRLFGYRDRVLAMGARCYQGQVTTFRSPGSGYGQIRLVGSGS